MSIQDAQREAVRRGSAALGSVDLDARCDLLGLPAPQLVLRYLHCGCTIQPTGELISFRDLPGGQFASRSCLGLL
jgi:hypothetical protein